MVQFCPTSSRLQKLIDDFSTQCDSHDLVKNYDTTKVAKFGKQDGSKLYVNGLVNEVGYQHKYLGIISTNVPIREHVGHEDVEM